MTDYISITETNKLMRKVLKESFPGVKFSVRGKSYAGGGSTNIGWTDGPNAKQVEGLISVFEGSYFDGMIDYKGSRYGTLDGQDVHFMTDFIFCNRDESIEFELRVISRIANKYDSDADTGDIHDEFHNGSLYDVTPWGEQCTGMSTLSMQATIRSALSKHTFCPFPKSSETLARVKFSGDDGYGQGTVGRNGSGGNQGYSQTEQDSWAQS